MLNKVIFLLYMFSAFVFYQAAEGLNDITGRHHSKKKHSRRNHFENSFVNKTHITQPSHHSNKETFLITKKAEIEGDIKNIESVDQKDKRGFLANLASLLNDAEAISGHRSESGLSSFTLTPEHNTENSKSNNTPQIQSTDKITEPAKKKEDVIPSSEEIQQALKSSSKDFAPIFAMFHGKIIPLGKLPENAFKKSRTELPPDFAGSIVNDKPDVTLSEEKHNTATSESKDNSKTNEKRKIETSVDGSRLDNSQTVGRAVTDNEKKLKSEVAKLSKLQQYLTNLDGHTIATGAIKNVRGTVKDTVTFPDEEAGTSKSEILSHVKGVVLDNGKILSVNNNKLENNDDSTKSDESQQKFVVTDDGSLTPINKAKNEIGDAVTRDTTGGSEGQKTVALSLDVLKDLLKKSDNKISLASLLNKNADSKSETPAEDEDPGTIEDFAAGGLKSHNEYRSKHHDEALIWSDDLAAKAQKLAEALADKKTLEIAKNLEKEGYGENVAKVWATFKNAGEAATKMWYSQSENYHFDDPHLDENTGQFAQLVWHNTKELGMGVAKSIDDVNNKYVYVTALYKPPGNIEATLRENVLPTGNNTVDVYTTFFKRGGVEANNIKRSKLAGNRKKLYRRSGKLLHTVDGGD